MLLPSVWDQQRSPFQHPNRLLDTSGCETEQVIVFSYKSCGAQGLEVWTGEIYQNLYVMV